MAHLLCAPLRLDGHVTLTTHMMNFTKEILESEERQREINRREGRDIPGTYKKPSNNVFPTPRVPWETPRGQSVMLFKDFKPPPPRTFRKEDLDPTVADQELAEIYATQGVTAREIRAKGGGTARFGASARASARAKAQGQRGSDMDDLRRKKEAIEEQIAELDKMIKIKEEKEQAGKRRPERPFAVYPHTYRAPEGMLH